jgi:FecR protein
MPSRELALAALLSSVAFCVNAQTVISTHSGVVHYFEGAVYLSGRPIEARLGKFASMADGSELRTEQGRAEVLLTPGVVLRLDQNSSIRMLSNTLDDTRVELLTGSAMVDAGEPVPGTSLTVLQKNQQIRFTQAGLYRLDSAPPRLWVREGEAQVAGGSLPNPVSVERGMDLDLTDVSLAQGSVPSTDEPRDGLDNWSRGREDSISADNAIAANIQDPATVDPQSQAALDPALAAAGLVYPAQPGFTQFPMLGLSSVSPVYSSLYPYQPGFYSLYLPGYTYRPLFLVVSPTMTRNPGIYSPYSSTVRPVSGIGSTAPRAAGVAMPYSSGYYSVRPIAPIRPVTPSAVRPSVAPRVGGVRR